jgi:hypothetical protein
LAELRLRTNVVEAALVINLPQRRFACSSASSKGYSAFRPFIAPADLSLFGGYVGDKRMLWLMATVQTR